MPETSFLSLLTEFNNICDKNHIFYSLTPSTFSILNNQKLNQELVAQVYMDLNSYEKLKELETQRVVDNMIDSEYFEIKPRFLPLYNNWKADKLYIEILILVPTTVKTLSKFYNFRIKHSWTYQVLKNNSNNKFGQKLHLLSLSVISKWLYPMNYKMFVGMLYQENFQGFMILNSPLVNPTDNWINHVTFEYRKIAFNYEHQQYYFNVMREIKVD